MSLLEGPYFINLATLCFKVISKCSSCAEQHAWRALAWHQVNPLVIAGVSFLWRGRLLQSQMGFREACQGNFKIWNVTEEKVTTSFNCPTIHAEGCFSYFHANIIYLPCVKTSLKNVVSLCICLQLSTVLSAKLQPSWSDCRSLCKSLKWWNLVAIAAN